MIEAAPAEHLQEDGNTTTRITSPGRIPSWLGLNFSFL